MNCPGWDIAGLERAVGLPGAQAEGSVEQHRCVCTGLGTWHLIPPVPVLWHKQQPREDLVQ